MGQCLPPTACVVVRCLVARAQLCADYITLLGDADFVRKSKDERVAALLHAFLTGAQGMDPEQAYYGRLQRHFNRNHGNSLARALHATVRAVEFSFDELQALVIDGISYIPAAQSFDFNPALVAVEEVWACLCRC